jgi:hypothetical protein
MIRSFSILLKKCFYYFNTKEGKCKVIFLKISRKICHIKQKYFSMRQNGENLLTFLLKNLIFYITVLTFKMGGKLPLYQLNLTPFAGGG